MKPDKFIAWLAPTAQETCRKYRLFASVCVAQGALESGWGKYVIGEFNLFGRKWDGIGPYIEKVTKEYYNGEWYQETARFKDYSSLADAVEDWCVLITQDRQYAPCLEHLDDIVSFVSVLGPIYATDPEYADKVLRIIRNYDLTLWDE